MDTLTKVTALRRYTLVLARLNERGRTLQAERNDELRRLRSQGWGLDKLAAAAGVTKSRMQQLVKKLEGK